jgi:dTDP-4-amino-4,6-dideoxygalactose transaminase
VEGVFRRDNIVAPMAAIPHVDVKAQYAPLLPEIRSRLDEVLESGRFILGPNVRAFEEEAAVRLGVPRTIGVANGTDAIVLALDALRVGPGDEVICPAFTFYATAEAVARTGATPVFADVDPVTLNVDPADVAARVTPRTKALLPVHLFGRPAPLAELAGLGVPIVEDAAQAFGAPGVARTGVASTFSFFPTKNLFCLGDGGLVAVTDEELGERIRLLRFHGSVAKEEFLHIGYNSRLDELQAAVLRLLLTRIDDWNAQRREAAARYRELLEGVVEAPADEPGHVYHQYTVRSTERDRLSEALRAAEIEHKLWYSVPLHLQPALRYLGYSEGSLPETERAARENLALPMWAGIEPEQQERIASVLRSAARLAA